MKILSEIKILFCVLSLCTVLYPANADAKWFKIKDMNGTTNWIVGSASGKGTFDKDERINLTQSDVPDSFPYNAVLPNPEKSENAWRITDDNTVEYVSTGKTIITKDEVADSFVDWLESIHGADMSDTLARRIRKLLKDELQD